MILFIGDYLIIKTLFIVKDNMYAFKLVTETSDLEYLKKVSSPYEYEGSPSSPYEIQQTFENYVTNAQAFGVSGIQLSFPYRVFTIHVAEQNLQTMFNPELIEVIDDTPIRMNEGCLSFPNLFLSIARPTRIKVQYQDVSKKLNTIELTDYYARGFLHELDHLNGIVFTSHAGKLALKMARKKLYKKMKKYKQS